MFHKCFALSLLATLAVQDAAHACSERIPNAPNTARLLQLAPTRWKLYVSGYRTRAASFGKNCAFGIGLKANSSITGFEYISVSADKNASTINQFLWLPNSNVANGFRSQKTTHNWTGFHGTIAFPLPGGTAHTFAIYFSAKANTSFKQLASELTGAIIATDDADRLGRPLRAKHAFFNTLTATTPDPQHRNAKLLYNAQHTTAAARPSANSSDRIFATTPTSHSAPQRAFTGWKGAVQDQDARTVELVTCQLFALTRSRLPDLSRKVSEVTYRLFGTGQGAKAFLWTLTVSNPIVVATEVTPAISLAKPRSWPSDASTVHVQDGDKSRLSASHREFWSYRQSSSSVLAWRPKGTVIRLGALSQHPTIQAVIRSRAYGVQEVLRGPEALYPDSVRGDQLGFEVSAGGYADGTVALVMLSGGYLPGPIPSPFGLFLIQPAALQLTLVVSKQRAATPHFAIPAKLKLAAQAAVLDFTKLSVELSDATRIETQ